MTRPVGTADYVNAMTVVDPAARSAAIKWADEEVARYKSAQSASSDYSYIGPTVLQSKKPTFNEIWQKSQEDYYGPNALANIKMSKKTSAGFVPGSSISSK